MPARSPDDVVFAALIEDATKIFFDQFDKSVANLASKTTQGFNQVDKSVKQSGIEIGLISGVVGGVTTKLISMFQSATSQITGLIKESTMLAARADTLGVSLDIVGKNAGYTTDQMGEYENGLRKTGITILAARQSLAQMIQANLDLGESAKLARVAQDAAVIAGVNSSDAFQRILHGITTLQPEILRGLGLVVNMQQEVDKYAAKTGKAAEAISYTEKQQLFMNATMKAATSIAGAYEAAMTTTGKKLNSLDRYIEDTKVLLGEAFEPALGVAVDEITERLKDMQAWFEENKEEIAAFAEKFAEGVAMAFDALESLLGILVKVGALLPEVGKAFVTFWSTAAGAWAGLSGEELEERQSSMGQRFKELISLVAGAMAAAISSISDGLDYIKLSIQGNIELLKLNSDEADKLFEAAMKVKASQGRRAQEAFNDAVLAVAKYTGAIEVAADAEEEASFQTKQLADNMEALQASMSQATAKLNEFYMKMQEDASELLIKQGREATEAALKESYRQEDLAREHAANVSRIMQGAAQSQQDAMQRHSQTRIDIERDYQRRIRDLKRSFEFEAEELARARDAVGLLRLMRSHKQQLDSEKTARDDRRKDAERQYREELQRIEASKQAALEALAEQERLKEEEYQRGLKRQEELQALHDQWAEEDRKRKYAKALADLLKNFKSMEGMTDDRLEELMNTWRKYFGDLVDLAYAEMQRVALITSTTTGTGIGGLPVINLGTPEGPPAPGPTGQMGLVSQMLADVGRYRDVVTRVPPSRQGDQRGASVKEIVVHVDGSNMDPYIQRQVANTLYEIERNNDA